LSLDPILEVSLRTPQWFTGSADPPGLKRRRLGPPPVVSHEEDAL
jgi:hypothetical protein